MADKKPVMGGEQQDARRHKKSRAGESEVCRHGHCDQYWLCNFRLKNAYFRIAPFAYESITPPPAAEKDKKSAPQHDEQTREAWSTDDIRDAMLQEADRAAIARGTDQDETDEGRIVVRGNPNRLMDRSIAFPQILTMLMMHISTG